jgi:hypothetical protein
MKLTLQAVGALVLTVSVFVLGGWLLQVIITKWLLTFGITTQVDLWLCVLTNLYLVGLFSTNKK